MAEAWDVISQNKLVYNDDAGQTVRGWEFAIKVKPAGQVTRFKVEGDSPDPEIVRELADIEAARVNAIQAL